MVGQSDPTHEDAGEDAGSGDIQRIQIKGDEYVLLRAEKYQQLLVELESIDSALELERARTEESKQFTEEKKPVPANDTAAEPKAALKAHEVGEHLEDGTVCIAVDLKNDNALFAPEGIFGGNAKFDDQDEVLEKVNAGNGTHGHKDWRRITDAEGKTLSEVWNKVAPPALQGSAAPWFWGASAYYGGYGYFGRVWRGGEADWDYDGRFNSRPVPVVFSGPARR